MSILTDFCVLGLGLEQNSDGRILVSSVDEGSPAKKASTISCFCIMVFITRQRINPVFYNVVFQ